MWIFTAWLTFRTLDNVLAMPHRHWLLVAFLVVQLVFLATLTYAIVATSDRVAAPPPKPHTHVQRASAYLVVHLDLKVSPPVALFVHTYSCSAKNLTHTGAREARADLYMIEADTFQEALDEMERLQPLYFPWATPLLTRKR